MGNHPVKLDMNPFPRKPIVAAPRLVRLYLIRHEDKVFYFMAHVVGFPNMRVAVADVEAEYWVGGDPKLSLEDRAKAFAQEKIGLWVKEQLRQRPAL